MSTVEAMRAVLAAWRTCPGCGATLDAPTTECVRSSSVWCHETHLHYYPKVVS